MAYLGGPIFRRRQQLRLAKPPPGGFGPPPHKLREKRPPRRIREEQRRAEQRKAREVQIVERLAVAILVPLAVGTVVLIILAVVVR